METWKEALSGAYSSQDYAGMFVLSGNIGEVCIRIATRSKVTSVKASTLLQEAKEHLDYALQIVEQCNMREVLGGYKTLYQGVRRVEILRKKAEKLADKVGEEEAVACTTCGRVGKEVVLDENDGCYYCTECYDEYYAAVVKTEENAAVDAGILASDDLKTNGSEVWASDPAEQDNGSAVDALGGDADVKASDPAELVVPLSYPSHEPTDLTGIAPAHKVEETAKDVCNKIKAVEKEEHQENPVEVAQDRIRYERVELGSLADFLTGKPRAENDAEQLELLQKDDALVAENKHSAGSSREEDSIGHQDSSTAQTSDEVAPCVETLPAVLGEVEDTADSVPSKLVYLIAHLLELRKNSPRDCPEPLLTSPVRDDGTATTARTKTNSTKKKSNGKKTSRSATSVPEKTETHLISPLPTLELCNAMRKILQECEDQQVVSCDSSLATGTTAALFGLSRSGACPPLE
ncbi:hypothetical protein P3T76_001520 [Phytophthora citrophthora]|uniref:Uncharacterized protein n=1 Tax=Phytophthora citrophthora TaxID=4793 RepID=A0AAD9LRU2_9STRA|nr:hypothetical protein P3T76_001520 [Phytophthora citrophthora]